MIASNSSADLALLSGLLFNVRKQPGDSPRATNSAEIARAHSDELQIEDLPALKALAMTNHVIIRTFDLLQPVLEASGRSQDAKFVAEALTQERARIVHALGYLDSICRGLEESGCKVTVIKSLDHCPDLGSDLDLFTDADAKQVVDVMQRKFKAQPDERSWGDRLANKWNFIVPGLPELVEVHIGRLGQTGEQTAVTHSVATRGRTTTVGQFSFRITSPEDRIIISTLQRMYRHFYIRLCDVVDNADLIDSGEVDFTYLHSIGVRTGLWDGIATYLNIVSGYVESYRGYGLPLPSIVTDSAKFGSDQIRFRKDFLRVPILPHSLNLYAGEWKTLLFRGDIRNTLRLSLLPGLATAAAVEQKITGSDKGIW